MAAKSEKDTCSTCKARHESPRCRVWARVLLDRDGTVSSDPEGQVIAADLQEGMLQKLAGKIKGTALESRIKRVQCGKDTINVSERVDFILAFYMVHEVPDKVSFFRQLKAVLNTARTMSACGAEVLSCVQRGV